MEKDQEPDGPGPDAAPDVAPPATQDTASPAEPIIPSQLEDVHFKGSTDWPSERRGSDVPIGESGDGGGNDE